MNRESKPGEVPVESRTGREHAPDHERAKEHREHPGKVLKRAGFRRWDAGALPTLREEAGVSGSAHDKLQVFAQSLHQAKHRGVGRVIRKVDGVTALTNVVRDSFDGTARRENDVQMLIAELPEGQAGLNMYGYFLREPSVWGTHAEKGVVDGFTAFAEAQHNPFIMDGVAGIDKASNAKEHDAVRASLVEVVDGMQGGAARELTLHAQAGEEGIPVAMLAVVEMLHGTNELAISARQKPEALEGLLSPAALDVRVAFDERGTSSPEPKTPLGKWLFGKLLAQNGMGHMRDALGAVPEAYKRAPLLDRLRIAYPQDAELHAIAQEMEPQMQEVRDRERLPGLRRQVQAAYNVWNSALATAKRIEGATKGKWFGKRTFTYPNNTYDAEMRQIESYSASELEGLQQMLTAESAKLEAQFTEKDKGL